MRILSALFGLCSLSTSLAFAAPSYNQATISLDAAQRVAQAALQQCQQNGHRIAVTVVDISGRPKVQLVNDSAFLHSALVSQRKAFTAVSRRLPTAVIEEATQQDPAVAAIVNNLPDMITWGGGKLIEHQGQVIGAIGISGAPGGSEDIQCADAGLAAL